MIIAEDKVVSLSYELKNGKGDLLDVADRRAPFVYLHGASQIVPGLERALAGLKVGDHRDVVVQPEDGYGNMDPSLKMEVERTRFPSDIQLEVGLQFETETEDGETVLFTVCALDPQKVTIDGNHPLAGQTLHFKVDIIAIRDATEEEKSHGHAHGDGTGHVH